MATSASGTENKNNKQNHYNPWGCITPCRHETMAKTVNLSSDGKELLEEAKSIPQVEPTDRNMVETALEEFVEQHKTEHNN